MKLHKAISLLFITFLLVSCFEPVNKKQDIIDIQIPVQEDNSKLDEDVAIEPEVIIQETPKIIYDLNILNDDIIFSSLPDLELGSGKYAVVASNNAHYYPFIVLTNDSDLKHLKGAKELKIGTIISIEEVIEIKNTIHETYFNFEGDKNYFYKSTIDNEPVLIWGADLIIDFDSNEEVKKMSYNYKKDIKSNEFLQFNGKYNLTIKDMLDINENHISLKPTESKKDIVSLYSRDSAVKDNTLFITTDLFSSSLNILFNGMQQSIEEDYLHGKISMLIDEILIEIERLKKEDNKKNTKYTDSLYLVDYYFQLGKVLLNYTDDGEIVNELLTIMPQEVGEEYTIITNENGSAISPITGFNQDYSFFIPEGHYKDSDKLKAYFMSIKWFSEMTLNSRMALIISELFNQNEDLLEKITDISEHINFFSKQNSYTTLGDVIALIEIEDIYNLSYWMENDEDVINLINESINFNMLSVNETTKTTVKNYNWSTGLDFMSELGSITAKSLLDQQKSEKENDVSVLEVKEGSYKDQYLYLIESVATFEQSKDFFFMERGKWNQKTLNSALGSWTENLDDSILNDYHEYLDMEEESDLLITFRTINYNDPIHFIEPNSTYFFRLLNLLNNINEQFYNEKQNNRYKNKIEKFISLVEATLDIVKLEIATEPISDVQNSFISSLPAELYGITGNISSSKPVIREVYTDVDSSRSLEVGTGYINRLLIPLKDEHGGKRIATGYSYSYYEFESVLTDINWQKIVGNPDFDRSKYIPFWAEESLK